MFRKGHCLKRELIIVGVRVQLALFAKVFHEVDQCAGVYTFPWLMLHALLLYVSQLPFNLALIDQIIRYVYREKYRRRFFRGG